MMQQLKKSAAGTCASKPRHGIVNIFRSKQAIRHTVVRVASDAGLDGIVFGKPQAPKELYESIAREARQGLMSEVKPTSSQQTTDAVLAALHLASEDDAIKTRTHIPLPVDAFSKRLDNLATEVKAMLPEGLNAQQQLEFIKNYVFTNWRMSVAKSMEEGLYSPYRVYMHQVLAQRCGTQVACAAVLHSLLARLHAKQYISWKAKVGLTSEPTMAPVVALTDDNTSDKDLPGVTWMCGVSLIISLLDQLKKAYWSWDWPLEASSGFPSCARAFLGEAGRAGKVNAAVGVMQASGRPFGNVELAMLASERLCLITQHHSGADSWQHHMQVRDYATQLLHVGRASEALPLLQQCEAWVNGHGQDLPATELQADLVHRLVVEASRQQLEKSMTAGDGGSAELTILDPDRDA